MKINYNVNGDVVDVNLSGELDTPATLEIQPEIDKILSLCSKEVVIDCKDLSYIASSGLRQLITIHKGCKAAGGHMKLINVQPDPMEILHMTHFDTVFDI